MKSATEYLRFVVTLAAVVDLLSAMAVQTMAEGLKELLPGLAA